VYVYELSPGDRERFADYEVALAQELAALAVDTARERDWAMLGPARIEFETADDLEVGRFRLRSRVEADEQERDYAGAPSAPVGAAPVGPHTAMLPGQRPRPKVGAPASLVLVQGGQPIRTWPLAAAELSIGRAEQSDIPLADPGVSRNHARVVREGDDFIVEDLRSTNGTEVNGQPIRRRRLANGDMLKLASSTLQFRREG
jgi:predicted component of type VI protein secretion system